MVSSKARNIKKIKSEIVQAYRIDYRVNGRTKAAFMTSDYDANELANDLRASKRKVVGPTLVTLSVNL